jgi:hypothetical protein
MEETLIENSNHLVKMIEELHTDFIDSRDCVNADEATQYIIDEVKNISKTYYKSGKDYCVKNGTNNSIYVEICIWGHIHNLNKPKAIRVLNKYKREMSDEIDGMLFDGQQNGIHHVDNIEKSRKVMSNEEGVRLICEHIKNMTHVFELLIELI